MLQELTVQIYGLEWFIMISLLKHIKGSEPEIWNKNYEMFD